METGKKYSILVTGGCGFIGWNFINKLFNQNNLSFSKIVNVDSLEYSGINTVETNDPRYSFFKKRIGEITKEFLREHEINLIVNFAAATHVDNSITSSLEFVQSNISELVILAEAAKAYWNEKGGDNLFIQISTDEVFGSVEDQQGMPFNKDTPHHPNNPYSATKSSAESILRAFFHTYNFPVIITNCSNNYGPGQHPEKLIPKIISNWWNNEDIPIYGDGSQKRDWLFVDDHCEGIVNAILFGVPGQHYLFGTNKNITNLEITKTILHILNDKLVDCDKESVSKIIFVEDRLGHDKTYRVDYADSYFELNWIPQIELKEGLTKTVEWSILKHQNEK